MRVISRLIGPALAAFIVTRLTGAREGASAHSGLPPLGLPIVVSLVLLAGFGEETGWRAFALARLQRRFGPAAWHAPLFFIVESYRAMTLPMIAFGFGVGICAGALVLSRVCASNGWQRPGGGALARCLQHDVGDGRRPRRDCRGDDDRGDGLGNRAVVGRGAAWRAVEAARQNHGVNLMRQLREQP